MKKSDKSLNGGLQELSLRVDSKSFSRLKPKVLARASIFGRFAEQMGGADDADVTKPCFAIQADGFSGIQGWWGQYQGNM